MDNKISTCEAVNVSYSDLDMPLFTSENFAPVITSFIRQITKDQWMLVGASKMDVDMIILLSDMCREIVESLSFLVLQSVAPQIESGMCDQTAQDDDTSITRNKVETSPWGFTCHSVTKYGIILSLGNLLHFNLCEVMGVEQERSDESDMLNCLVAAQVTERVNRELAAIRGSTSSTRAKSAESPTEDMVFYVFHVLRSLILTGIESPEDEGSLYSHSSECLPVEVTKHGNDEDDGSCEEGSGPDEASDVEEFSAEEAEPICSVSEQERSAVSGGQSVKCSASPAENVPQRENTFFLIVFLSKLLDHIAHCTKTSISDLDFDGVLERLRESAGEINPTVPQSVGNVHIPIYKEPCLEFGSAKLLQVAVVSRDVAFEEAVARTLKAQLHKSSGKSGSFVTKVRRFLARRTSKVAATCVNTSVSHSEVRNRKQKQKRPAIMRMFSSLAILKNSQFFKMNTK